MMPSMDMAVAARAASESGAWLATGAYMAALLRSRWAQLSPNTRRAPPEGVGDRVMPMTMARRAAVWSRNRWSRMQPC